MNGYVAPARRDTSKAPTAARLVACASSSTIYFAQRMNLKLSDWANIAGIASGVAVVVTLVFLIIGIRENTAVTRASMYERSADRLIELRNQALNDPEIARLWQAYLDRRPEGIDGVDAVRLRQYVLNQFQTYEQAYFARQYGVLGDAEWRRFERQVCTAYPRVNAFPDILETVSLLMTDEFMAFMESSCGPPAPAVPAAVEARDMRLVGLHDLQARSAYQPIVHAYGERRILFVGHHGGEAPNALRGGQVEVNGLSVLDVTDPGAPIYLAHVPPTGDEARGTQHVQVCDGAALPDADDGKVYLLRTNGLVSYELLDVTDPAAPGFLRTIAETGVSSRPESDRGDRETHKFQWDCASGIAYFNGTAAGWGVTRVLQAFDLGNPEAPRHVRDFALAGWEPGAPGPFAEPSVAGLHQPFVVGDRMYWATAAARGVLQFLDRGGS
jgi:hypothetical protein